jgi:E3 ubiquitin-protein ligase MUL1
MFLCSVSQMTIYFQEDGTGCVYVVGARGAAGLELTVASEVIEESGRSLVRDALDYMQGLKVCVSH